MIHTMESARADRKTVFTIYCWMFARCAWRRPFATIYKCGWVLNHTIESEFHVYDLDAYFVDCLYIILYLAKKKEVFIYSVSVRLVTQNSPH